MIGITYVPKYLTTAEYNAIISTPIERGAYFSPSWTAFQSERGRDFSVIVDGISN